MANQKDALNKFSRTDDFLKNGKKSGVCLVMLLLTLLVFLLFVLNLFSGSVIIPVKDVL